MVTFSKLYFLQLNSYTAFGGIGMKSAIAAYISFPSFSLYNIALIKKRMNQWNWIEVIWPLCLKVKEIKLILHVKIVHTIIKIDHIEKLNMRMLKIIIIKRNFSYFTKNIGGIAVAKASSK